MHGPVREENDAQLLFEKLSFVWARAEVRWEMQKEEKKIIDLVKVTAADLVACTAVRFVHEEINGAHICRRVCRQELDIDKKKRRLYTIEW